MYAQYPTIQIHTYVYRRRRKRDSENARQIDRSLCPSLTMSMPYAPYHMTPQTTTTTSLSHPDQLTSKARTFEGENNNTWEEEEGRKRPSSFVSFANMCSSNNNNEKGQSTQKKEARNRPKVWTRLRDLVVVVQGYSLSLSSFLPSTYILVLGPLLLRRLSSLVVLRL